MLSFYLSLVTSNGLQQQKQIRKHKWLKKKYKIKCTTILMDTGLINVQ